MDLDNREFSAGRLSPFHIFASLEERFADAEELETRAEAMAEQRPRRTTGKRFLVGLVDSLQDRYRVPALAHPIFEKTLMGVRSRLAANGCDLLLCATRLAGSGSAERRASVEQTIDRGVSALVAWGMGRDDPEVEPILSSGLPAMFVDIDVLAERCGYVTSANVDAMAQVTKHLYETGRRRIAHIAGNMNARPGPDRLFGYRSELDRLGLPLRTEYIEHGDFNHTSGYEAAQRLLALPEPPDAVAAASDSIAIGAMVAIAEAKLHMPAEIAVTGFDDMDYAATVQPSLTTVRQDPVSMGAAAAEGVLRMLEDPDCPPPVVVIPTELIVRESSGAGPDGRDAGPPGSTG